MQYLWINYLTHEEDDPTESYVELDDGSLERRRIDIYDNGMSFAYGGVFGGESILSKTPYPDPVHTLNRVGELEVTGISARDFEIIWGRMQERPTGFLEASFF